MYVCGLVTFKGSYLRHTDSVLFGFNVQNNRNMLFSNFYLSHNDLRSISSQYSSEIEQT